MGEIIRRRSRSSKSLITTKADSESEVVKTENSPFQCGGLKANDQLIAVEAHLHSRQQKLGRER